MSKVNKEIKYVKKFEVTSRQFKLLIEAIRRAFFVLIFCIGILTLVYPGWHKWKLLIKKLNSALSSTLSFVLPVFRWTLKSSVYTSTIFILIKIDVFIKVLASLDNVISNFNILYKIFLKFCWLFSKHFNSLVYFFAH